MTISSATRDYWIAIAKKIAHPLLHHLSKRTLRPNMPIEGHPGTDRERYAHLEGFGRLLAGLAPWLESTEAEARPLAEQARAALDAATDPTSPDFCNFHLPGQPVVDAAFLAQGILRAPYALWHSLDSRTRLNVITALKSTRSTMPGFNNWLLFSAMIETALRVFGETDWDKMRVDYALRQHEHWYKGDGLYGDGSQFHADYYNSFVIHPMLIDISRNLGKENPWKDLIPKFWERSTRYAAILERQISPEGTFPPIGRSLAYRFGALQSLAQMALLHKLPNEVRPEQVRCAMTKVIQRTMEAPGTFDENGWLRIGFCGSQMGIAEPYICTGSVYLCSVGLLPLGLPADDPFWNNPDESWTSVKAWGGEPFPIDKAIHA